MPQTRNTTPPEFSGSLMGLENFGGVLHEQCGILVENRGFVFIREVPNRAENPTEDYGISLLSFQEVKKRLMFPERIIGFFHTHLPHHPAEPSGSDWMSAEENDGMWHVIFKPDTGEVVWYMG